MFDFYTSLREIRQMMRSLGTAMAFSMLTEDVGVSAKMGVYPELVRLPLRLYLYVPP